MTEEKFNALRQADTNLRDALKMDEAERPQMPADLNERLMQRMAQEEKKPRRVIWPWIAAACVAGVMMIWLTPPKSAPTDVVAENTPKVEQPIINNKVEEPSIANAETEAPVVTPDPVKTKVAKGITTVAKRDARFGKDQATRNAAPHREHRVGHRPILRRTPHACAS